MGSVELHQLIQINGADTVPVGQHEGLIANIGLDALHASAGHGVKACVHKGHLPRLGIVIVDFHLIIGQVKGHI